MISAFAVEVSEKHMESIQNRDNELKQLASDAEQREKDRLEAKRLRKLQKEAERKAAEIEKLRQHIEKSFIKKGKIEDQILTHEIVDIDGFGQKEKHVVGVIGGFLGQLMIVLNTIAVHYKKLDQPVPTKHQKPKEIGDEDYFETVEEEHEVLDKAKIQRFMYDYVNEKLKTERLPIQVAPEYEIFLHNLLVPLELNQIRTMKEFKYVAARELLRKNCGGIVMELIAKNRALLGIAPGVFNLVYEGFWDLYCLKSEAKELKPKRLQNWTKKIKLIVNESTGVPE